LFASLERPHNHQRWRDLNSDIPAFNTEGLVCEAISHYRGGRYRTRRLTAKLNRTRVGQPRKGNR
jgi:hypothetical protein